ncbi:hypothetical protein M0R19_09140 [Candidatus Pacearchaeota archaeon]|nr:hypothetical protein [Candidatus Pacearchaeota archaeon]
MPIKEKKKNFEKEVMFKVASGSITMRPKWYFIIGSIFSIAGLVGLSTVSIFLINIILFLLRKNRLMGQWKLEVMINSFPWWILILAIFGIALGIWMLKKYDFSYKKNFFLIIISFVFSIIIAGFIIDNLGLNEIWSRRNIMRRFYQQIENQKGVFPNKSGKGNMQNGFGNGHKSF